MSGSAKTKTDKCKALRNWKVKIRCGEIEAKDPRISVGRLDVCYVSKTLLSAESRSFQQTAGMRVE